MATNLHASKQGLAGKARALLITQHTLANNKGTRIYRVRFKRMMKSNNGGDIGGKFSRGWKPYFRT